MKLFVLIITFIIVQHYGGIGAIPLAILKSTLPKVWVNTSSYPYAYKNHVKSHFGVILEKIEDGVNGNLLMNILLESTIVDLPPPGASVELFCYHLGKTLLLAELRVGESRDIVLPSADFRTCVPMVSGLVVNSKEDYFNEKLSYVMSLRYNLYQLTTKNLNYLDANTSTHILHGDMWFREIPHNDYSFYETARVQLFLVKEDFFFLENYENFLYYVQRLHEILNVYNCYSDRSSCGNNGPTKYEDIYNRKIFYKAECEPAKHLYTIENTETLCTPLRKINSADVIPSANTKTIVDTWETLGLPEPSLRKDCGPQNIAAYHSTSHIADINDHLNILKADWRLFHETGHNYDLYHTDDYFDLREVHVNLWSHSYQSRYKHLPEYWIDGGKNYRQKIITAFKERKLTDIFSQDYRAKFNFLYALIAFKSMGIRDFQRDRADSHKALETEFLQTLVMQIKTTSNYNIMPTLWQLFEDSSADQLAFLDILDRYTLMENYEEDKNLYPCGALEEFYPHELVENIPDYAYETGIDTMSALQLCRLKSKKVMLIHYNQTHNDIDTDLKMLFDGSVYSFENTNISITTSLTYYPWTLWSKDSIVHPIFTRLHIPNDGNELTWDVNNYKTKDWENSRLIQRDSMQFFGLGDVLSFTVTIIREGAVNLMRLKLVQAEPHYYYNEWLKIFVHDHETLSSKYELIVFGGANKNLDTMKSIEVQLPKLNEMIKIHFPDCKRFYINGVKLCESNDEIIIEFETYNHLSIRAIGPINHPKIDSNLYKKLWERFQNYNNIDELSSHYPYIKAYGRHLKNLTEGNNTIL